MQTAIFTGRVGYVKEFTKIRGDRRRWNRHENRKSGSDPNFGEIGVGPRNQAQGELNALTRRSTVPGAFQRALPLSRLAPTNASRRTALVTGASAGLGRVFAEGLARDGYDLVLVARDRARLQALADELAQRFGTTSEVLPADLSRDDDTGRVVARLDAAPVDVLINNAGFGASGSLARAAREPQDVMLRVHVVAVHRLSQAAVQGMARRGSGAIVTVSSVASYLTSPGNANYCATKAYQRLYAETLAMEVAGRGIYVQALCPGFTHTEFHQRAGVDKSRQPRWLWMDAERVVRESLAAMRREHPVVVIPGRRYRVIVFLLRWLPKWMQNVLARSYRRR